MISSKITDKLVLIVIVAALLGALMVPNSTGESAVTTSYRTEYASELFNGEVISLDFQVDKTAWDEMIASAQSKTYIMADVVINGVTYQSVGVRTKGNASLSQVSQSVSPERYSLRIKFDEYIDGQTCLGLDELVLNNMIADPSYMKEYLSQDLMRFIGVEAPLTNYASLSVNGEGAGFYVALESYGESYNRRVYGDNAGNYYNVKTMEMGGGNRGVQAGGFLQQALDNQAGINPPESADWNDRQAFVGGGGGSRGGSLEYSDDNPESYPAIFDNAITKVSASDQENLIEALKALSTGEDIDTHFDIDQILRYFAAHTVLVNLDSYYSNMAQNYVIQERDGVVSILPWDYHLAYGGFQSGSASDVVNAPIDTPLSGVTMESRPLLNALLSNEIYAELYHQYLDKIVTEYFGSGLFEETVRNLQNKISTYVQNDPTAFTGYDDFTSTVDTLISLNMLRAESISGQLDGTIPSTTVAQTSNSTALIDASSINMSDLGSMGMGGNRGERPGAIEGENPAKLGASMPDQALMRQAMEIVRAAGGELTEAVKTELIALGITEEQLKFFENMQGGFAAGEMPTDRGIPQDDQNLTGQNPPTLDQGDQVVSNQTVSNQTSSTTGGMMQNEIILGALGCLVFVATFLIARFRRSY
ncbi:MAG: CotH kinase family protein [Anaerolineaceae bacterium]